MRVETGTHGVERLRRRRLGRKSIGQLWERDKFGKTERC